jgi:hypothetical protein
MDTKELIKTSEETRYTDAKVVVKIDNRHFDVVKFHRFGFYGYDRYGKYAFHNYNEFLPWYSNN